MANTRVRPPSRDCRFAEFPKLSSDFLLERRVFGDLPAEQSMRFGCGGGEGSRGRRGKDGLRGEKDRISDFWSCLGSAHIENHTVSLTANQFAEDQRKPCSKKQQTRGWELDGDTVCELVFQPLSRFIHAFFCVGHLEHQVMRDVTRVFITLNEAKLVVDGDGGCVSA